MKRKQSSDCGRRIRKRVRQLTRASEGRHGAPAHRVNPTEVWNKVARRRKGSRMRRLAGGERSTRFEPASQHSQLPHLRTGGLPSKSTIDDCVRELLHQAYFTTFFQAPKFLRTWADHFAWANPFIKLFVGQQSKFQGRFS